MKVRIVVCCAGCGIKIKDRVEEITDDQFNDMTDTLGATDDFDFNPIEDDIEGTFTFGNGTCPDCKEELDDLF